MSSEAPSTDVVASTPAAAPRGDEPRAQQGVGHLRGRRRRRERGGEGHGGRRCARPCSSPAGARGWWRSAPPAGRGGRGRRRRRRRGRGRDRRWSPASPSSEGPGCARCCRAPSAGALPRGRPGWASRRRARRDRGCSAGARSSASRPLAASYTTKPAGSRMLARRPRRARAASSTSRMVARSRRIAGAPARDEGGWLCEGMIVRWARAPGDVDGEGEGEVATPAGLAVDRHAPTVRLDDPLDDEEAPARRRRCRGRSPSSSDRTGEGAGRRRSRPRCRRTGDLDPIADRRRAR